jgi:hypothetical protein
VKSHMYLMWFMYWVDKLSKANKVAGAGFLFNFFTFRSVS